MAATTTSSSGTGTKEVYSYRVLSPEEVIGMTEVTECERDALAVYRSGIGTLRSSAHRVKANPKTRKKQLLQSTSAFPPSLYEEDVLDYDPTKFPLRQAFTDLLGNLPRVGQFRDPANPQLEDFCLPVHTLDRKVNGGCCEETQAYLSQAVADDARFLQVFDELVEHCVLPYFKQRLLQAGILAANQPLSFYIQRPPTLRIQPGPGRTGVKPHHDGEYGHQHGELNFWLPLTDRNLTQVDLWCETLPQKGDYHPIPATMGQVIAFHGSTCRHFVHRNDSTKTRVSMDFRIGVQGFFDPAWQMNGTTDDHGRRTVEH